MNELLTSCPSAEFKQVLHDMSVLFNSDLSSLDLLEYHKQQFTTIALDSSDSQDYCILSAVNYNPTSNSFFHPNTMKQFTIDPSTLIPTLIPSDDIIAPDNTQQSFNSHAKKYSNSYYPPTAITNVFLTNDQIHILIVSDKINSENFCNGKWTCHWTLDLKTHQLSGIMRATVHYFEDGNVQLECTKQTSIALQSNSESIVFSEILKAESGYQMILNETNLNLSETTFKSLRRALPVTRSKIEWNSISNYKIGSELTQNRES